MDMEVTEELMEKQHHSEVRNKWKARLENVPEHISKHQR
jgi:hypothetical protein